LQRFPHLLKWSMQVLRLFGLDFGSEFLNLLLYPNGIDLASALIFQLPFSRLHETEADLLGMGVNYSIYRFYFSCHLFVLGFVFMVFILRIGLTKSGEHFSARRFARVQQIGKARKGKCEFTGEERASARRTKASLFARLRHFPHASLLGEAKASYRRVFEDIVGS
jgi:hypothetical protein